MKIRVREQKLAELDAGSVFSFVGDGVIYMAVGKAFDGKRNIVNLEAGVIHEVDAVSGVDEFKDAEMIIVKG